MAATIAYAEGHDKIRIKAVHRLGSESSHAKAATWRTFAAVIVYRDGSGEVEVKRDGRVIHRFAFDSEAPRQ